MSTIIQVKDLNLWYGAHHALHGVNIDIPEHEITALIGPFGCGKSTFLKTLNRMNDLVPGIRIEGEVNYAGQNIYAPNVDTTGDGVADEGSLRGSSEIVAKRIQDEIQSKVADAGIEIVEARITYLAYAPEIAAVMLQRQQASAIIDARKMIVDGAVGMVEMALDRLSENKVVELDDERKAAMVSNLLVVLCGNHEAQPVVNTGSLY